ncbi:Uncharacterised protein [Mycobacteroides abscessus]|nr:Uncharacterised protein [Mycobacteroides abscessus]
MRWLGEHACRDVVAHDSAGLLVIAVGGQPGSERDGVELGGARVLPWGGGVDLRGQRVQGVDQLIHLLQSGLGDREIPCELTSFTVLADVDGVALAVPAKSFFAELGQQIFERILVGGDPLAADLEELAVDNLRPGTSADPVPRLKHRDRVPGLHEPAGSHQAGDSGANDHHVTLDGWSAVGGCGYGKFGHETSSRIDAGRVRTAPWRRQSPMVA